MIAARPTRDLCLVQYTQPFQSPFVLVLPFGNVTHCMSSNADQRGGAGAVWGGPLRVCVPSGDRVCFVCGG